MFNIRKSEKDEKKLKFMFDYNAGWCLWNRFGITNEEWYGLTPETVAEMKAMSKEFDTRLNWDYPPDGSMWSEEQLADFNRRAAELYKKVVAELGSEYEVELDLY